MPTSAVDSVIRAAAARCRAECALEHAELSTQRASLRARLDVAERRIAAATAPPMDHNKDKNNNESHTWLASGEDVRALRLRMARTPPEEDDLIRTANEARDEKTRLTERALAIYAARTHAFMNGTNPGPLQHMETSHGDDEH